MRRTLSVLTLTLITMVILSGQDGDGSLLKVGDKAPVFSVKTLDGKVVNLEKNSGKVVMVTFFATWCGPCNVELPVLEKNVWNKYKDNKDFVLVVLGREHDEKVLSDFAKTKGLNLPFAPDMERAVFAKYAEKNIPRNVIIGRDGKIVYQSIGYTPEEFAELEATLAAHLK